MIYLKYCAPDTALCHRMKGTQQDQRGDKGTPSWPPWAYPIRNEDACPRRSSCVAFEKNQ